MSAPLGVQCEWLLKAGVINAAAKSGEYLMAYYTHRISTFIIPERDVQVCSVCERGIE